MCQKGGGTVRQTSDFLLCDSHVHRSNSRALLFHPGRGHNSLLSLTVMPWFSLSRQLHDKFLNGRSCFLALKKILVLNFNCSTCH